MGACISSKIGKRKELRVPNEPREKVGRGEKKSKADSPLENHSSIGEAERGTGERRGRREEMPTGSQMVWQKSGWGKGEKKKDMEKAWS